MYTLNSEDSDHRFFVVQQTESYTMDRLDFPLAGFVRLLAASFRCNLVCAGDIDCNNLYTAITAISHGALLTI